jgi:hypothetical protein
MNTKTDQFEPPNEQKHFVLPFGNFPFSARASSHDSVVAAYPHGISFIDQLGAMEGYLTLLAVWGSVLPVWAIIGLYPIHGMTWSMLVLGIICALILRSDTISYRYQPTMFNRRTGNVHVFVAKGLTWWKFWQLTPPSRIETWDWACARAEVVEFNVVAGSGVPRREYALVCVITDQPGGTKVMARFGVGLTSSYDGGEAMVQRWEHIRRFMMEDGPHLAPGDSLFHDESTIKLWDAITWGQPLLGPGSKVYWTGEVLHGWWFLTIPGGAVFLMLLPFTVISGLLRMLSHALKREPTWTAEILADVGGRKLELAELPVRPAKKSQQA